MHVDLPALRQSLNAIATEPEHAEAAAAAIERWLDEPAFSSFRPLLLALIAAERWDDLLDSFYRVLPFGTGGRRGAVGIGPNRINPWSIGTSVQGNIDFLRQRFGAQAELSVVIAADVRVFRDLRGIFPDDVPNPLLGMTSTELARQAAAIYVANGIDVHMLDPTSGRCMATPELSFLIRRLGAAAGLNVSASHNPPDDNGGKFYNEQGAQEVPPDDERMVELVAQVESVRTMTWEAALASGKVHFVGPELHDAYLEETRWVLRGDAPSARIVFTNLHGVGDDSAGEALEAAGFEVHYVASQRPHDGLFPNVPFLAPNPEYPSAYGAAIELAREVDADIILATDPDVDRIGAMVPDASADGGWRFLNGNQLSSLVAAALFEGAEPGRIGIKTEVTSSLFARVVEGAGGQLVQHLLVGCKYIADVIHKLDTEGRFGDVEGGAADVLIGTEESHGFLLTPNIRDKDGAAPALVRAELASRRKDAGSSVLVALRELYAAYGAVGNVQMPLVMTGVVGRARIEAIQQGLRQRSPEQIAGRAVTAVHDRRDPQGVFGPILSGTDDAARDVLAFQLGPDYRVVIRPSGTEPKTKIYAEAILPVGDDVDAALARAEAEARALASDFIRQGLALIDMEIDEVGLHCSPLLGAEERIAFGAELLPQAVERAARGEDAVAWLQQRCAPWGRDGLALCEGGWRWFRDDGPGRALDATVAARVDGAWR